MPLLLQLTLGTNRITESRGKRKVPHMAPSTAWFHLQDCCYIPGQRTPLLPEDISHTFLLFIGYRTAWSFNWLKTEVLHFNYMKSPFYLFNLLQNQDGSHVNPEAFFCSNGDAHCCPNSSCSTQWNPGICGPLSSCQQSSPLQPAVHIPPLLLIQPDRLQKMHTSHGLG